MSDEQNFGNFQREEIEGAPPVASRAEMRERRLTETVTLNRYLYRQCQQLEHMLLDAEDLQSQMEDLLVSLPRHFSFRVAELWLYDPEKALDVVIVGGQRYGPLVEREEECDEEAVAGDEAAIMRRYTSSV